MPKPTRAYPKKPKKQTEIPKPIYQCEAEVVAGLEKIAHEEIRIRLDERVQFPKNWNPAEGVILFQFTGNIRVLNILQTVQAVYLIRNFPFPRPRAFLGDENFKATVAYLKSLHNTMPEGNYHSLTIHAAGADSPDIVRFRNEIAAALDLQAHESTGDLLIRLRRPYATSSDGEAGWDLLVRTSPRPLATRAWRIGNMEGALNATVASAMALLTAPHPQDLYVNLLCGSGTLMIERAGCGPVRRIIGCDTSISAREIARRNVDASGYQDRIQITDWDARHLPLEVASVDALTADLPFGNLMGSHEQNLALYPALLQEVARVAKPNAPFVLITAEVRLMESLLQESPLWKVVEIMPITLRGLHPRIFILQRTA